ncbi:hypothetical protein LCGC14_0372250 [marine sediment metagenome]|uniref:HNH nuclease domain-containing protein n=1 Tax=marine sediment metagenome TaxID=412755 RepID=A0A0F9TAI4_9ZZZZ
MLWKQVQAEDTSMTEQGLLWKEAPESRFELYCTSPNGYSTRCNILFKKLEDYNKHNVEVHKYKLNIKELPLRPKRRFHTTQTELDNRENGLCWCGKPKDQWNKNKYGNPQRRGYCSDEHYKDWWKRNDNNAFHRRKFLRQSPRICNECGAKTNYREMDHIIAIVLGGHPWDYRNLQSLCEACHKKKTVFDIKILAWWKRDSNYDTGSIIPNNQHSLEEYVTID